MTDALYDYSLPYSRLRYKYKTEYRNIISERAKQSIILEGLTAKNGYPLRYLSTPTIRQLAAEIRCLLDLTSISDNMQTVLYEGFYSSIIEGARTTIADTIRITNGEQSPATTSEHMVYNNIRVINEYFYTAFPFTEEAILHTWNMLVEGTCENEDIRGNKYRIGQVVVGTSFDKAIFEPPHHTKVQEYMDRLCNFFAHGDNNSPLVQAIIIHYYFAYTHPFCDGNGRMSRFLLQQWLAQNPDTHKLKYISLSGAVNESRTQYYKALESSENELNDISYFVEYYLRIIELQLQRSLTLFGVNAELNQRQSAILKNIHVNGISLTKYASIFSVDISTAKQDLDELVALGDFRHTITDGEHIYYKATI